MKNPDIAFAALQKIIAAGRGIVAGEISKIAYKHRRMGMVRESYERLFGK